MREAAVKLEAAGVPDAWSEALLLMGWALGLGPAAALVREEAIPPGVAQQFLQGVEARSKRKPYAYISGVKPFLNWDFTVTPEVLIPRPETEILVELAAQELKNRFPGQPLLLADIGTGCGVIGLSLLLLLPLARLCALDNSLGALRVAKENARKLDLLARVDFFRGDLLSPLGEPRGDFHCLVANLPYVSETEYTALQPEITGYEPRQALVSGPEGLQHYRRFLPEAGDYLAPGGLLAVEIGCGQGQAVKELFITGGFPQPAIARDLAGLDRIVWATKNR